MFNITNRQIEEKVTTTSSAQQREGFSSILSSYFVGVSTSFAPCRSS